MASLSRLVWEGDVYGAAINQRYAMHKQVRHYRDKYGKPKTSAKYMIGKSTRYKATMEAMTLAFRQAWDGGPMVGPVLVRMRTYWGSRHRQGAADGQARGDVDATCKAALDALEDAGVVANDAQVESLIATKHYDPKHPRIEVDVEPWDG